MDRAECWLVFAPLVIYFCFDALVIPAYAPEDWRIPLNAKSIFENAYEAFIAVLIAIPLANALLPRQRYGAFAVSALALLPASSFLLEFVIDPLVWDGTPLPIVTYFQMVEIGTMAALLLAIRLLINRRRNERRLAELQRANVEAELQYLKAQINPHVLFNALNNIYSHALHQSEKTPALILKLADMLRYMIYDCAGDEVCLEREVAFLSDYVDIQTLAVDRRGTVEFTREGIFEGQRIAPFLLIPFVENCFKHSLDTLEDGIDITIDLKAEGGRLQLECSNTFDPSAVPPAKRENSGIGLTNVKRRLKLLLGEDFQLDTSPRGKEFSVMLNIPVHA